MSRTAHKNQPEPITATAATRIARNPQKRLRIEGAQMEHLDRILAQFEAFCIVTQSVRDGIPVNVSVVDAEGAALKQRAGLPIRITCLLSGFDP